METRAKGQPDEDQSAAEGRYDSLYLTEEADQSFWYKRTEKMERQEIKETHLVNEGEPSTASYQRLTAWWPSRKHG